MLFPPIHKIVIPLEKAITIKSTLTNFFFFFAKVIRQLLFNTRSQELAMIISYPTSASGITVSYQNQPQSIDKTSKK